MDAVVTARIPVEIKEQGNAKLHQIGSTPTQLINAAYNYLLATGTIPSAEKEVRKQQSERKLTAEQIEAIRSSLQTLYVGEIPADETGQAFKEKLQAARDERYARFA